MRKVRINPQLAAEWLTKIDVQRNIKKYNVAKYASDMAEGRWANDITPIVFDTNGNLANGQHRLKAIVLSGETIDFWVLEGVEPSDIERMDSGITRSVSDQLTIKGIKHGHSVQSIGRIVMQYELWPNDFWNTSDKVPSKAAIVDRVLEDPSGFEEAALAMKRFRLPGAASNSTFGAFYYLANIGSNCYQLPDYIDGLFTGARLDDLDPRLALRAYVVRENLASWGSGQSHFITHVSAWNSYVDGKGVRILRTPHRSIIENNNMPKIR